MEPLCDCPCCSLMESPRIPGILFQITYYLIPIAIIIDLYYWAPYCILGIYATMCFVLLLQSTLSPIGMQCAMYRMEKHRMLNQDHQLLNSN